MRFYEAQYRNTRDENFRQHFADGFLNFNTSSDAFDIVADVKGQLDRQMQIYVDTFSEWALGGVARAALGREHRCRERGDAARGRQDHRVGARARRRRLGHAHGVAGLDASRDHPCRLRRGADRSGVQLADRAQHHAAAQRPGAGDDAARRRRHLRPHPRHQGQGRARRHGAHRHRVPRHHARARTAGAEPGRRQPRAREPRRGHRRHHHPLRDVGRPGARRACARPPSGWRAPPPSSTAPPTPSPPRPAPPSSGSASPPATSPPPPPRSRSSPPRSARSPARRTAPPKSPRAPSARRAAPSAPCRSSATPPPASARWWA